MRDCPACNARAISPLRLSLGRDACPACGRRVGVRQEVVFLPVLSVSTLGLPLLELAGLAAAGRIGSCLGLAWLTLLAVFWRAALCVEPAERRRNWSSLPLDQKIYTAIAVTAILVVFGGLALANGLQD